MSDIWFKAMLENLLNSKEQAARRSMQGAELAGYLAALSDLRTAMGLNATPYEVKAERWIEAR